MFLYIDRHPQFKKTSAAYIISFLELSRLLGLVTQHYLVGAIPQHPVLYRLGRTQIHHPLQHLLEKLPHCLGVVQTELVQEYLLLTVWHHLGKVLNYLSRSLPPRVIENYVDGLRPYLFEVQLGPNLSFELF